jgi:aminopeptidase YwaD
MKKNFLFLLFVSITTIAFSQDMDYTRGIIKKMSSPGFMGRGYVDNGDKISAEFIADEFKSLGLMPGNKRSYFQKFNISINTFPGRIFLSLDGDELKPAVDYIIESSSPSIEGKFSVISATRSEINTEAKILSLIKKAGNSFILIDNRNKENETTESGKKTDEFIMALKYDPNLSVKGVIISTDEKLTWDCSTTQNVRPVITMKKDIDPSSVKSIEIAVEAKMVQKYETQNVVGIIEGSSGSDSTIVVLAHYDHLGKMGSDVYFPGANDNASGVAMLLNLAKHYSEQKPEYTMLFIALSAEEAGILGAKEFTYNPLTDLKKIRFLINFDLAGTGEEGIKVVNGSVFKDQFGILTSINKEMGLLPKIESRGAACNSDHCLFYQKGVPCFYIYTLGGINAYHDLDDKYETLPLTEFSDFCKLIIAFFDSL